MQQSFINYDFENKTTLLTRTKFFLWEKIDDIKFEQIDEIEDILKSHSDLYYNKEEPIISDIEYDSLFKKLQKLEEKFNINKNTADNPNLNLSKCLFINQPINVTKINVNSVSTPAVFKLILAP